MDRFGIRLHAQIDNTTKKKNASVKSEKIDDEKGSKLGNDLASGSWSGKEKERIGYEFRFDTILFNYLQKK